MRTNWSPVTTALQDLRRANIALPIWWRDDDAIADTPQLDLLGNLSVALSLPVHLAIIPDRLEASLPPVILGSSNFIPLVHGWRHDRHEVGCEKKTEFGARRPGDTAELSAGLARLQAAFGDRLVPIFVPPWNILHDSLLPELARIGYAGVSTYQPRAARFAAEGLVRINTHIDPINWRGNRSLIKPRLLVEHIAALLRARLAGTQDRAEPLGLLTHHLVHDRAIWGFTQECLTRLLDGGAQPVNLLAEKDALP